ncbi:MAG: hypothetical protein IT384_18490 [Deltaproteobacteria bacterium]|nr:hypothetical protein [Deltaproteobacteria bacterium]
MVQLQRRDFLAGAGALGAWLISGAGCGYYPAESGDAYAPWDALEGEADPIRRAARAALLAASPHNIQPWRFALGADVIDVFVDPARSLRTMDGLDREKFIGLGCAVENLIVSARHSGLMPVLSWFPDAANSQRVARVALSRGTGPDERLFEQVKRRHTYRGEMASESIPGLLGALQAEVTDAAVGITVLDRGPAFDRFRAETIAATRAIVDDIEMNEDSDRWFRHTYQEIERERDGVTIDASGSDAGLRFLAKSASRSSAKESGEYWVSFTEGRQTTASAFVLLSSERRDSREQQLRVGRAYQHLHLWATSQDLVMQPLNQLPERQDREQVLALEPRFSRVLAELSGRPESSVQLAFRIGVAWDEAKKSPRRPLEWVMR